MFSTSQETMVKSLVNTMKKEGYHYYLAYTRTNISYNTSYPDLYIYFSREEILAPSSYTFYIPPNSVLYTIRTGNYSSSSSAVNTDRIVRSVTGDFNQNVNVYEFIYTTARGSNTEIYQPEVMIEGSESLAGLSVISILLSVVIVFTAFWKMWQIRR